MQVPATRLAKGAGSAPGEVWMRVVDLFEATAEARQMRRPRRNRTLPERQCPVQQLDRPIGVCHWAAVRMQRLRDLDGGVLTVVKMPSEQRGCWGLGEHLQGHCRRFDFTSWKHASAPLLPSLPL